ncbi:MAG TPA: N-acetylmuramoyl-L-alanine amidase [Steroidobacteraceae bacterium]|jgi:N-acetyl-anhydromuramyl-L-alanine amidase AmpD|nr:N-acetylmuramoyl-L-alanine amidase [Steroidobacteraceae bacterium]
MTLQLGSHGPDVLAWQSALSGRGYAVGTPDGDFGKVTHNATCAFQTCSALPTTGIVGAAEQAALHGSSAPRPAPVLGYSIPFVASRFFGAVRAIIDDIVLHSIECPEASTRAETCAQYMADLPVDGPKKSAHYYCDSDTVVQGVPDHRVAYAAPGANAHGLHIEHAGYARQTRAEWLDDFSIRMLSLSAQLCARKCREYDIPIRFLRSADLRSARPRGITTHYEVSQAFLKSDHTDPGKEFPIDWYIARVQLAYDVAGARV